MLPLLTSVAFLYVNSYAQPVVSEKMLELGHVMSQVQYYYHEVLSEDTIAEKAITGLLRELDPHSSYLNQKDFSTLHALQDGTFHGIGIELSLIDNALVVVSPIDNSPASKAGIQSGDIITHIDNKLVHSMSFAQAVEAITGPVGTKVHLHLLRDNVRDPIELSIERQPIDIHNVSHSRFPAEVGYLRISYFDTDVATKVSQAITSLTSVKPLKGLIIDLRNNPGGMLSSTIATTKLFISKQDKPVLLLTAKDRNPVHNRSYYADGKDITQQLPLVILVNQGSASGAEIMAVALQQHKRAVIMGDQTFGKGSVQTVIPLEKDTALKLTTGMYLAPSGLPIQGYGVTPDIKIPDQVLSPVSALSFRDNQHVHSVTAPTAKDTHNHHSSVFSQATGVLKSHGFLPYQALMYLLTSRLP